MFCPEMYPKDPNPRTGLASDEFNFKSSYHIIKFHHHHVINRERLRFSFRTKTRSGVKVTATQARRDYGPGAAEAESGARGRRS